MRIAEQYRTKTALLRKLKSEEIEATEKKLTGEQKVFLRAAVEQGISLAIH